MFLLPRFIPILICVCFCFGVPTQAQAWWFWGKQKWQTMSPEEQNIAAEKLFTKAESIELQKKGAKKATKLYLEICKRFPVSDYAPIALNRAADNQMANYQWKKALDNYQDLVTRYPNHNRYEEAIERIFQIGTAYEEGFHVYFAGIFPIQKPQSAISTYERLVSVAPYHDLAPLCLMRIALLYTEDKSSIGAIDAYDRLINFYPRSMMGADAHINLGKAYRSLTMGADYDQYSTREAINIFQDFLVLYPQNPSTITAEESLAETLDLLARNKLVSGVFYYKSRDFYDAAKIFFNDAITIAPHSKAADEAREYLAVIDKIEEAYPDGNYPRRTLWQHLIFWKSYHPESDMPGLN
jgi:outer membrane protein assembly factor BamD